MRYVIKILFAFLFPLWFYAQTNHDTTHLVLGAETDHEFDKGSKLGVFFATDVQIENLVALGKVWGFLKYYHPAVAAGNYNWDYELFRILPQILTCKNKKDCNIVLYNWIKKLGNFNVEPYKIPDSTEVKLRPDLAWLTDKQWGDKLSAQLVLIKDAKREKDNYYLKKSHKERFSNEVAYKQIPSEDEGLRLLALFRIWNIMLYDFPYKNLIEENWHDVLKKYVPEFIKNATPHALKKTMVSLIAKIHDSHANISHIIEGYSTETKLPPIKILFIDGKAIVSDYLDTTIMGKSSGFLKGDVIEQINGKTVNELLNKMEDYTPASNRNTFLRDVAFKLLTTTKDSMDFVFKRDTSLLKKRVKCFKSNNYRTIKKIDTCFKWIDSVAYLYPGLIKEGYFEKLVPELKKSKGMIIDFRSYPASTFLFDLCDLLLPYETHFAKAASNTIEMPGLFTLTYTQKIGKKNPDYYKHKVVTIVNETTQSAAEYVVMALQTTPNNVVIGSQTAGADGNIVYFLLPTGIKAMFSGLGIYYPDGRETQRVGIAIDIEVKPTIKGIKQNRDELLEKAIELVTKKN